MAGETSQRGAARPVLWWAALGAVFLAVEIALFTAWIVSGNAKPTPRGSTPVPGWMKVFDPAWEVFTVCAAALFLYYVVIRPWRREGRITTNGIFTLVIASLYWQDPFENYSGANWISNSNSINFGSWTSNIPGDLLGSSHKIPEPFVWGIPVYIVVLAGAAILGSKVLGRIKRHWPRLSAPSLVFICFGMFFVFDFVFEIPFLLLGFCSYPGAIKALTIFHGHYYQFPVYEAVFWGGTWSGFASVRYFVDRRGRMISERKVDEIKTTATRRTWLRTLSLIGVCNLIYLAGYNIPIQWFSEHPNAWPKDIVSRSYLMDGLCGPGTHYVCPGGSVPSAGARPLLPASTRGSIQPASLGSRNLRPAE
jgi:hypothetical protein